MTKACIDCGKRKPLDDFYRVFKNGVERQSRCKPCDNRKRAGRHTMTMGRGVDAVRRADGSIALIAKGKR